MLHPIRTPSPQLPVEQAAAALLTAIESELRQLEGAADVLHLLKEHLERHKKLYCASTVDFVATSLSDALDRIRDRLDNQRAPPLRVIVLRVQDATARTSTSRRRPRSRSKLVERQCSELLSVVGRAMLRLSLTATDQSAPQPRREKP
jgi:hypothetical protein